MANVKASASHNLTCESSAGAVAVVKHAASAGLQCNSELVKGNAGSLKVSHNQHYAGMSDTAGVGSASHSSKCEHTVADDLHIADNKNFKVRFIYNSGVVPRQIDALLARKHRKSDCNIGVLKNRTVWNSGKGVQNMVPKNVSKNNICTDSVENVSCSKTSTQEGPDENPCLAVATDLGRRESDTVTAEVISSSEKSVAQAQPDIISENRISVNTETTNVTRSEEIPIYNVNYNAIEDKFASSIIHVNSHKGVGVGDLDIESEIFKKWRDQSQFDFGYIPIDEQRMPKNLQINKCEGFSPLDIHEMVKATGVPNFMHARIPVKSQLNVQAWKNNLEGYWDEQLCQLIEFGFPLDFNRSCPLKCDRGNHKSALEFPADVDAYIAEELEYGAILGPFDAPPIHMSHSSPFMTRAKPNSDRRRVIIDLSWPLGACQCWY